MENQPDATGITRNQNQLHVLAEDPATVAVTIAPLLDRLDATTPATQALVIANDSDAAADMAYGLVRRGSALRVAALTETRRAGRVLRERAAQVAIGPPQTLLELLQATLLKTDGVQLVVLAWVDELGASPTRALEALMSEMPKDAARVVIASAVTPKVDELVERYAWRARRLQPAASVGAQPSLSYLATTPAGRLNALRRVLDALDPESAFVVVRDDDARANVDRLLGALGYGSSGGFATGLSPDRDVDTLVLFDVPATDDDLRAALGTAKAHRIVALTTARQVSTLRRLGRASPLSLPDAATRARSREDALRDELREQLVSGHYARELLAVEPLLSEYDGAEVAAAALRLLEAERGKPRGGPAQAPPMTRLYLNIGETDNVRPGDLVGAITNEAQISKTELGRVDVRDRHSTVEVATGVADAVVAKLTGVTIRGRRVVARIDEPRDRRERGSRDGSDRRGHPAPRSRRDDGRAGTRGAPRKR